MVSISAAGTNEISEPTRYSLADKMEALDKENVKKMIADLQMVKGKMNSLKKKLHDAEELNESLRKEKNDEIGKLKENYERVLKEKAEELERLKTIIEEERNAKIPPKFPAKIVGKLCKKDCVDSLRKTIVVTVPPSPTQVGKQVLVKIDVTEAGYEALDITVKDPDGHEVATQVAELEEGVLHVEFKARLPGNYGVHVHYAGKAVNGVYGYYCGVFDVSKVMVGKVDISEYNKTVTFYINDSKAGIGRCEVAVNEEIIGSYSFTWGGYPCYKFTRDETKDYVITVRFNDETVPGTPIHVKSGPIQK